MLNTLTIWVAVHWYVVFIGFGLTTLICVRVVKHSNLFKKLMPLYMICILPVALIFRTMASPPLGDIVSITFFVGLLLGYIAYFSPKNENKKSSESEETNE